MLRSRASLFVETVKYDFSYDNTSRLLKASFTQNAGTLWNTSAGFDFTMAMGDGVNPQSAYDANGNIKGMTQYGRKATSSGIIDQLTYSYYSNSNKLGGVADAANDPSSTLGDFKEVAGTGSSDYFYDLNGNLMLDANKNIKDLITYNHLNLPEKIVITGKGNIQFWYDANGNKLRKKVTDNTATPAKITTTDYIGNFVFEGDILEFASHEEGRIRPITTEGAITDYAYDYFIKDHLGNVRAVLTDKSDASLYTATMETERAATETALFSNMDETRAAKPVGYPQDQTTQKNEFVAKLNAKDGGKKIGPSLVIKVMAGDTVQIGAKAFYKSIGPKDNRSATPEDMIASLLQVFSGTASSQDASHAAARQAGAASPFGNFNSNDYQRLKEKDPDHNRQDKPKAYLNFALFDDQFNLVEDNSGVRQVKGEADELQTLAVDRMTIKKNGFLHVYTSNETPQDVFFDNVTLGVTTGPVVEETHYYPYGLTMSGISSNALKGTNYAENRKKYNGNELQNKEFSDGSGLEWYDFNARAYDQQIGRFLEVDPIPGEEGQESLTPYHFSGNNPATFNDPNGKCPWCWGAVIGAAVEYSTQVAGNLVEGKSLSESLTDVNVGDIAIAAAAGALTSGVSAFVPKTAAAKVAQEVTVIAVGAVESAAKQYNETGTVSVKKTLIDVGGNIVGDKLTKNVTIHSSGAVKSAEKQLNRAERIAAGDATSSGRAATVKKLGNKVAAQKAANRGAQQAAGDATANVAQANADIVTEDRTNITAPITNSTPVRDNTTIKKPIIPNL